MNSSVQCPRTKKVEVASIRDRFMKEVVGFVPPQHEDLVDYYESWASEAIDIEGFIVEDQ